MKIRKGFVSNSSSSSFIVFFPEIPKDVEHVRQMLFGDAKIVQDAWPDGRDTIYWETSAIAERVFSGIISNGGPNNKGVIEDACEGWDDDFEEEMPSYATKDTMSNEDWNKGWDEYNKKYKTHVEKTAKNLLKDAIDKNLYIYTFEFSDNEGSFESFLEHGEIFSKLPYKRISRH